MPSTKRKTPAAAKTKLQYPDPDKLPKHLFWLAIYFRDIAEAQAIKDLCFEMHQRGNRPDILFHALYGAIDGQRKTIRTSLGYVLSEGMLLFAFDKTAVFDLAEVAQ